MPSGKAFEEGLASGCRLIPLLRPLRIFIRNAGPCMTIKTWWKVHLVSPSLHLLPILPPLTAPLGMKATVVSCLSWRALHFLEFCLFRFLCIFNSYIFFNCDFVCILFFVYFCCLVWEWCSFATFHALTKRRRLFTEFYVELSLMRITWCCQAPQPAGVTRPFTVKLN